jgi:hypothetical protein
MGHTDTPIGHIVARKPVKVKMPLPDNYDGSRSKLKAYLMQLELYIGFNSHMFVNKPQKVL